MSTIQKPLSAAIEGFQIHMAAEGLSPNTQADYNRSLRRLVAWYGEADPIVDDIDDEAIAQFMASLDVPASPAGIAPRPARPIGKKQRRNIHTGLSAFWTWAVKVKIATRHVMRLVDRPRPEKPAIIPYSQDDIKALLAVCERSRRYARPGKRECDHRRPTGVRDQAIILLLLDTGLRASELCSLTIRQVDLKRRRVIVYGKGDKQRMIPFSPVTAEALWQFASEERTGALANEPFFTGSRGALTRSGLLQLLQSLGERAGVDDVFVHRFRHTFAVSFLRNNGDPYSLQDLLGHESMETVRRYVHLARADLVAAHQKASPVANWQLGRNRR